MHLMNNARDLFFRGTEIMGTFCKHASFTNIDALESIRETIALCVILEREIYTLQIFIYHVSFLEKPLFFFLEIDFFGRL